MGKSQGNPAGPGAGASLDEWLRWQEAVHPKSIELGLDRVSAVAARLGLLGDTTPTLTVAGTNGKGSSTVLLSEICRAAGHRVGTYTSPHLHRYNERVAIDGQPATDAQLTAAFAEIEKARGQTLLTYFEYGTLAALWLFKQARVEVRLLEVGLGGRLDAVNIVDADCALITSIGIDHQEYLGTTREQIGREKAGIMRKDRPAVCVDPQPPQVVAEEARRLGAKLLQLGVDFGYQVAGDAWNWHGGAMHYKKLPPPALAGPAQIRNAAGVLAALHEVRERVPVSEPAIRAGLVRLNLPGRFERRGKVILDVAHNVEAASVLAENLRELSPRGRFAFVIGMLSDKPVESFCAAIAPCATRVYAGGLAPPRGLSGAEVARRAVKAGVPAEAFGRVDEAFEWAQADKAADGIVVCGSFLTVAEVSARLP